MRVAGGSSVGNAVAGERRGFARQAVERVHVAGLSVIGRQLPAESRGIVCLRVQPEVKRGVVRCDWEDCPNTARKRGDRVRVIDLAPSGAVRNAPIADSVVDTTI